MKQSFAYVQGKKSKTARKQTSKLDSIEKLWEKYNESLESIINIYYKIELAILTDNFVLFELGKTLHILKSIHTCCKKNLGLPDPEEITFPNEFIEEYTELLKRTNKAIESIRTRIEKLNSIQNTEPIKIVLEKNLLTLQMLQMHYINALGI